MNKSKSFSAIKNLSNKPYEKPFYRFKNTIDKYLSDIGKPLIALLIFLVVRIIYSGFNIYLAVMSYGSFFFQEPFYLINHIIFTVFSIISLILLLRRKSSFRIVYITMLFINFIIVIFIPNLNSYTPLIYIFAFDLFVAVKFVLIFLYLFNSKRIDMAFSKPELFGKLKLTKTSKFCISAIASVLVLIAFISFIIYGATKNNVEYQLIYTRETIEDEELIPLFTLERLRKIDFKKRFPTLNEDLIDPELLPLDFRQKAILIVYGKPIKRMYYRNFDVNSMLYSPDSKELTHVLRVKHEDTDETAYAYYYIIDYGEGPFIGNGCIVYEK